MKQMAPSAIFGGATLPHGFHVSLLQRRKQKLEGATVRGEASTSETTKAVAGRG